jgi:hypothetical protein
VYYATANLQGSNILATSAQNGTGVPSSGNTNTAVAGKYKFDYSAINWGGEIGGFTVGYQDIKKFGDWSLEYTYRRLEKDAWLDFLPDSSFYNGPTNVAGHRVKILFGLAKNTSFGLNFYDTWKVRNFSPTSSLTIPTSTRRLSAEEYLFQADVTVKF